MFVRYFSSLFLSVFSMFQLFTCRAIKIPNTTSTISPIAYLKYFIGLLSSANVLRIFLKIGIIRLVCHNEAQRYGIKCSGFCPQDMNPPVESKCTNRKVTKQDAIFLYRLL